MKIVGEALESLAIKESSAENANLYGRSAFNRYYYASFLVTRETLAKLDPKWKMTPHAEIPTRLRETICISVKRELEKQVRAGLKTKSEKGNLLTNLQSSSAELAELLEHAYDARVVADYRPEELIKIDEKIVSLRSYKLTTARAWPDRANAYCKIILRVWKEVGLA
ncbi:hypothetical protein H8I69_23235 [Serratia fonticola]|uniref:hypothetical protein n=1 Tax=Serratia fonticola TaxID=47917 RepID=UPI0015C5BAFC|nr:hypothetical protein [Serratia fonticola]MBC3382033.1 hypothetical protein [Serratia fonticola]NYA41232.1 hypothetical protein [Serratia fonticola]